MRNPFKKRTLPDDQEPIDEVSSQDLEDAGLTDDQIQSVKDEIAIHEQRLSDETNPNIKAGIEYHILQLKKHLE